VAGSGGGYWGDLWEKIRTLRVNLGISMTSEEQGGGGGCCVIKNNSLAEKKRGKKNEFQVVGEGGARLSS